MTNLGNRLKQVREDNGKSKDEVAVYLVITSRSYSRYETGERVPDLETVLRLADFFGCSIDYLMDREASRSLNVIEREEAICYKDIRNKGYNGKLAHGLIKEIIAKQGYHERVHLSDNDRVNYVSKHSMRGLLMKLLAELV